MGSQTRFGDHLVTFQLNGQIQLVCSSVPGDTSLNTYIREYARLKGTKFMCREGGCGACIVTLEFTHPATGEHKIVSVNSCMFSVYACHGLKVTTVEGIGSKQKGYSEIQTRLALFYGTQCGYCSPGWVMSMFSLLEANPTATMKEIEDSFSGNLCRCTGYRPILDAFKSFASDRSKELEKKVEDIEDLLKVCKRSGVPCGGKCSPSSKRGLYDCVEMSKKDDCDMEFVEVALASPSLRLELRGGSQWYKVTTVDEVFEIFGMVTGTYMLVGGNTAQGILKGKPPPAVFIDINGVKFLKAHSFHSGNLHVGANTTLADAIVLFNAVADENPAYFSYAKELAKHIEKVANTPVRNVGTIAGNLTVKHTWRRFPSDIFLILETVGALVSIRGDSEAVTLYSLPEYLEINMYKKVILQIILPPLDCNSHVVKTFKIAPRAQNAIAYVNGGFKFKVNRKNRFRVVERPNIIFGGINPSFIHAYQTESFLINKPLLDVATLQGALNTLGYEVKPDYKLPDAKPEFRRKLTQSLLYRVVLGLNPGVVSPKYRSGREDITRPLSSGKQEYESDFSMPPLYQPFPKIESLIQCSGEAEYIYDIPTNGGDLYAALVITKQGPGTLESIDPLRALKVSGVVAFFSAKDIPGENSFTPFTVFTPEKETLFADKAVLFAGQPVGMVVAQTQELADRAAELVTITIIDRKKPVLDIRQVAKEKDLSRLILAAEKEAVPKRVNNEGEIQYLNTNLYEDDGSALNDPVIQSHTFLEYTNVYEPSVWGTKMYDVKTDKPCNIWCRAPGNVEAKAMAEHIVEHIAHEIGRDPLSVRMKNLDPKYPIKNLISVIKEKSDYESRKANVTKFNTAGVNNEGEIQYLNTNLYEDDGSALNDPVIQSHTFLEYTNVYEPSVWGTKMYDVKTDKPCNIWCRAPGNVEAKAMAEHIVEHIAHEIGRDPLSVRMKNLDPKYPIKNLISVIKEKSDYESRKANVTKFNTENVWKKRGISLVPLRFSIATPATYHAMVSIYRNDGTVAITHGGIEMGQGVNTKAAQVCAATLNIPLEMIVVKPSNNMVCPNDLGTGGSFTSEAIVLAVKRCCEELNDRLGPIRNTLVSPSWQALIQAAYYAQVNLNATYQFTGSPGRDFYVYDVFGVTVLEVEVDILTGEHKIIRVDILEDAGKSFNPFVDIGQIEGAFIMGLGYWTSEEIIYDPSTGRNLTNRTLVIRVDILEDAGKSFNPFIDIGQIEGAFVMGLGYWTSEEIIYDPRTGRNLTNRTLTYKIPGAKDIPTDFRVYILKNGDNPLGILRSKAVAEPPQCMANSVLFAIRQALMSARRDLGLPDIWLDMDAPFTGENICLSSGIDPKHYLL